MRMCITLALLSLALASPALVRAEEREKAKADSEFLTKVVPGVSASVKIIEYAAKNASDEKVRDFAERVAKEHKEFVATASANAKRLKIAVVTDPDKESKETIDKLSKLKGTEVDVAFLEWLIDGHEKGMPVFESEVKNGDDSDLKTMAKHAITVGKDHIKEARELLAKIKK